MLDKKQSPPDLTGPQPNPSTPAEPVVMLPVTAEQASREKTRKILKILGAVAVVLLLVGWIYKRSTDPIQARAAYEAGARQLQDGRYQEAILAFTKALDLESNYADAYRMRGQVYFEQADLDRAVADYTAAVKIKPDPRTLLLRASVYLGLKNYADALADCDRAIALDSQRSQGYNLRGSARRAQGDVRGALADFDHAVALESNADNHYQRGATYELLGEHQKAIDDFTEVIERAPDLAAAYFARAEALVLLGETERAREDRLTARRIEGRAPPLQQVDASKSAKQPLKKR